jgi:hypothetical protein
MYKINTEVINKETSQKWLDPGINENLTLTHRAEMSKNNNAFLAFTYTNEKGQSITKTEWEVNDLGPVETLSPGLQGLLNNIAGERGISVQQAAIDFINEKRMAQMRRIINVAKLFVPEEELEGKEFNNYMDFITFISTTIGERCNGVQLRVKLVYDNKGYVNTPDYVRTNTPWVERMDQVSEADSKMEIVAGLDRVVRQQPNGVTPPKKDNPLEGSSEEAAPAVTKEDMPF